MLVFKITYVIINVFSCWFIRSFVSTFIPAGKYRLFSMTRRISFCLFGQASSICNVKPCRRAFHLQLVMQDLDHNVKGHKKNEIWEPYLWGKKWSLWKKEQCAHLSKAGNLCKGWRQLARECYIKLIMGRWLCISEVLITLAVHAYIQTWFVQSVEPCYLYPCALSQWLIQTQDEKNKLHGLKCSCYL